MKDSSRCSPDYLNNSGQVRSLLLKTVCMQYLPSMPIRTLLGGSVILSFQVLQGPAAWLSG